MATYDYDPDVTRWGLHHLLDVCTLTNNASCSGVTRYDQDLSRVEFVREGYCEKDNVENDEAIAHALQEEFLRIDCLEASGVSNGGPEHLQESVLAQNCLGPSGRHYSYGHANDQQAANGPGIQMENAVPCGIIIEEVGDHNRVENNVQPEIKMFASCSKPGGEKSSYVDDLFHIIDIADESSLDGEVGKRLNQMVPVPMENAVPCGIIIEEVGDHNRVENDVQPEIKMFASCSKPGGEKPSYVDDLFHIIDIADESSLDDEVGKRLNQMVPVPMEKAVPCGIKIEEVGDHNRVENDVQPEIKMFASCSKPGGEKPSYVRDLFHIIDIADESSLDGEVGKRLNQMVPVPHVPKTIEKIPTADEEISDHQRLLERLQLYELVELKVQGDGNCQFRALSDQLYRSPDHHASEREQITQQLKYHPEMYGGYVLTAYNDYLKKMSKSGEWGDHVTLQATTDWGLLAFYGLSLPHTLVQLTAGVPTSLPAGVKYEFQTFPVDSRAIADGDGMTVYTVPREPSCVPIEVQVAAVQRSQACVEKNYTKAFAIHKKIIESGYRILDFQNNKETLARKYRIRLRGIDAPENQMPYGKEAKEELTKIVQGKCLRVLVYGEDQYGRCVADIYCDGKFVQELMLKKGFAWHYATYDQRLELARWEKEARATRVGLWASSNPEKPWEWRKKNKKKGQKRIRRKDKSEGR
ncbi:uncharacterized protein LOC126697920 isoform X3 [Quercus robur]|uniref:uncharacterized protein LOC126697920 isoform X3 n=1 Tax=Quercus robur TaxID=38942 RepID=UPI0021635B09|nr:uncharacterized protein LOC126697920 isoform X3 [Quercus robur]